MSVTKILNNTSFGLIRTNPKLSTNVKIMVNSKDKIFLESFNANEELSKDVFKGFKIDPNSTYERDLYNFWKEGKFPKNLAYELYQENGDLTILPEFRSQYDMFYSAGAEVITSKLYDEDMGMFAPLWLDGEMPKYFIIFRLDGPVTVNNRSESVENTNGENIVDPSKFHANVIEKSTVIKTIDLTGQSNIGKYIRNYANKQSFPSSPLFFNYNKTVLTSWRGINYLDGGFTERGEFVYDEMIVKDKTIIEKDFFMTKGFERNSVVCANLLNLEFLFDDVNANDFDINRYYGIYVNDIDEGTFTLDGTKHFLNYHVDTNQLPVPFNEDSVSNTIDKSYTITNDNGILLWPKLQSVDTVTGLPSNDVVSTLNSYFYIKGKGGNFYNLSSKYYPDNSLRLKTNIIDASDISGFKLPLSNSVASIVDDSGYSFCIIYIGNSIPNAFPIHFYNKSLLIGSVYADVTLTIPGEANEFYFNPNGTIKEVAASIVKAINNIPVDYSVSGSVRLFDASSIDNAIVIRSRLSGKKFNNFNVVLGPPNNIVTSYNGGTSNTFSFLGGSGKESTLLKIKKEDSARFTGGRYIKTQNGYQEIQFLSPYLSEPIKNAKGNITGYKDYSTHDTVYLGACKPLFNSNKEVSVYEPYAISFGRFSMFPVKDFDFDFFSDEYNRMEELDIEKNYYGDDGNAVYDNKDFTKFRDTKFASLEGILKSEISQLNSNGVYNEYDRLKENYQKELSNVSKITPFINKWVYKNGKDVRNHDYRLNVSDAFGINNFTPSIYEKKPNTLGFTHEWYYLSKIPDYYTNYDDFKYVNSYFNDKVYDKSSLNTGTFHDLFSDNFTDYFIVDRLGLGLSPDWTTLDEKQIRFSDFSGGSKYKFAETFFRGLKISVKQRAEKDIAINFNVKNLNFVKSEMYNNYKFAAILIPHEDKKKRLEIKVLENKKWKTITFMIFIQLEYPGVDGSTIGNPSEYIDRTTLYSLKSKYTYDGTDFFNTYEDTVMNGAISITNSFISSYPYIIKGQLDNLGVATDFIQDIRLTPSGNYGDITFTVPGGLSAGNYKISNIISIVNTDTLLANSFEKESIPGNWIDVNFFPNLPNNAALKTVDYTVNNGGYLAYEKLMEEVSLSSLYTKINTGDPSIIYETVELDGSITYNNFVIELHHPDVTIKSTYLDIEQDSDKPTQFNLVDTIGYRNVFAERIDLKPVFRHFGEYTPKFTNVLYYKDPYLEKNGDGSSPLTSYEESVFSLVRHANTEYNVLATNFGFIKNYFYHKVNRNNTKILELTDKDSLKSLYPLIGETAIDKNDFYIFRSPWDPNYFVSYDNKTDTIFNIGTKDHFEKKSFFSSKIMKLPNSITLDTFQYTDVSNVKNVFDNEETVFYFEDDKRIRLNCYLEKRLIQEINSSIYSVFNSYVNPAFGFGSYDSLDDDINEYIVKNISGRYIKSKILLYVLTVKTDGATDYSYLNQSNSVKTFNGLNPYKTFSVQEITNRNLDFDIELPKANGFKYSIGLSVNLIKR